MIFVARGRAPEGVAGRVVQRPVRLHLDDAADPAVRVDQQLVNEGAGHLTCVAGKNSRGRAVSRPYHGSRAGRLRRAVARWSVTARWSLGRPRRRSSSDRRLREPAQWRRRTRPVPPGACGVDGHAGLEQLQRPRSPRAGWASTSSASGTRRSTDVAHRACPTTPWAWRNGMPRSTSHSARSTAAASGLSAAACHAPGCRTVAVAIRPVRAASAARPGRGRRTAAPCPPAGPRL